MPELEVDFEIEMPEEFNCVFEIYANTVNWGGITGDIENQTDLQDALSEKADTSVVEDIDDRLDVVESTMSGYGDIVTYDADEFATAQQGALADTSLQPNDNISELNNNVGYITEITSTDVTDALGYTPYNSSNPNGYQANVIETIEVNNTPQTVSNKTVNVQVPTSLSDLGTSEQMQAINSGANTTNIGQITTNANSITTIEGKIPTQASPTNQLADKNFVNSSIATNTANFIGTFNSLADLEAYSGTLTNNDYAFVVSVDSVGNTVYNRYKWNGTAWLFEYALNNSSFTSNQWASINSGITSNDVTLIGTALQPNDNITQLTNNAGYITGITSSDVTSALGYTPYNSSNPNGYQANVLEAVKVNGTAQTITNKAVDISVPTDTSDLTNNAGYITGINSADVTSALGYTPQTQLVSGTNIKTVNSTSLLGSGNVAVQDTLVSGTNIKTINGQSVLGSGDLEVTATGGADTSLSNLNTTGEDRLHALKGYKESGQVYSDSQLYNDVYAQYSTATTTGTDLIITDNYTVVGTPTIVDGVASGFSLNNGNYVTTGSFVNNLADYDTWSIEIPITLRSDNLTNKYDCFFSNFKSDLADTYAQALMCALNGGGKLRFYLRAQDNSNIMLGTATTNVFSASDNLIVKIEFTGTQYIISVKKNNVWTTEITVNNSKKLLKTNQPFNYGVNLTANSNWEGLINLYGIRFIADNKLIYACKDTITYNISDNGNKIADVAYRPDIYYAHLLSYKSSYFTIDTINENVTLPYSDIYGLINNSFNYNFKSIQGYDGTATQTLKHVNGVLQWVTD